MGGSVLNRRTSRRGVLGGIAGIGAAALGPGAARAQAPKPANPVLVTVTGRVSRPNRGPFDPATDKFFGYHEISFERARSFTCADLSHLPRHSVRADFPKGGPVHAFSGPRLADVLAAAGAEDGPVVVQALDGYRVELEPGELADAVLAIARDGEQLGLGDFGPAWLVWPRAEKAELAAMSDDHWVWSIFHIAVG
ncbi:MAG: hypothetical protein D6832_06095 [Alphaproteobacteria bacterium]|nr:MAG: hypothetical protein D6832_06095 [Alphaproteobacteria bacterium]